METVSKIMAFIKQNENTLGEKSTTERKKKILEFEPAKLFNQVHPIVFQYLVEGIFNAPAFKRYVTAVFGKAKDPKDMERIRQNRRFMYHYKNSQHALYYKYLLIETNPTVNIRKIQEMYAEMVEAMNEDTDRMLDAYEAAEAKAKIKESEITDEKRKDLVDLLKKQFATN